MFAIVHKTTLFALAICALFFLSALPSVVRSQEEIPTPVAEVATPEPILIAEPAPYTTEGVPGGGSVIGDFVVGPGKVDATVKPGETKVVEMTITNRTGERRIFNINIEDAEGSKDPNTSIVLLGDDRGPYSIKDYLSVDHYSFELDQNQRARIPVTISVPANAEPGGLYGSVLVNTVALDAVTGDDVGTVPQSAIIARIGTLFFVTIPGTVEKEGGLIDFSTSPKQMFYQDSPINFGILFENKGSIHLAPYGELRITNMFGDEMGFLELEPWFVLPQSLRLREVAWDRDFLFGRYTATIHINRSYDDTVDTMSYSFWVLPWKPLAGGFAVVFFVLFLIRTFFKKFEFKRK